MGICTHCLQNKPVFAPVCHHCNNWTSFWERVLLNVLYYVGTLVVFFGGMYWIFS
jgi:predicted ATP-dependent serine protease